MQTTAKTKEVNYYVRQIKIDGSILIIQVDRETLDPFPDVMGKILYCSNNPRLINTYWREKKYNLARGNCQFSKKGFEMPNVKPLPYLPMTIPPLGFES